MRFFAAKSCGVQRRKDTILAGAALMLAVSMSTGAMAQAPPPAVVPVPNCNSAQSGTFIANIGGLASPAGAAGAALSGAIGNVNTAFLTQQGSAFVSAPANPLPDQPGGGVWARGVGGQVDVKSVSNSTGISSTTAAGVINTTTTSCNNSQRENFAGVQVGADIARLNWNGWNVHLGTTAGYLGAKSTDNNGFSDTFQVPFWGTYVVATKGRFFADLMVRQEFYNVYVNNTPSNYFNQPVGAHGYSISASTGYNFDIGNNWFIEPSAGFIYSNTSVDSFVNPGTPILPLPGLVTTNDVVSEIGRASVRVGKTFETPNVIWQPFASASVFHEFAGNVITNYTSLANGTFFFGAPGNFTQQTSTSRVGTYGQYSLGLAGQIVHTGWLGFVRVDYRNGENVNGWTGNAGIRYQFTPEMIAAVMPTKAPVKALSPVLTAVDWTGFYVGGVLGVAAGRTDIQFVGAPYPIAGNRPWTLGGIGGIEAGYNRQFSNKWVLGIEGDIVAANVHGGRTAGATDGLAVSGLNSGAFTPAFFTVQDKTNWMGTVTGRVGYAWGRTLIYAKGGAAFEDSSTTTSCIYGPTAQSPLLNGNVVVAQRSCVNQAGVITAGFNTPSYTRVGWTLGYGTEFDLGKNWSAKAEYDYISFGRHTALATDGTTLLTDRADISQIKIGVNYRFSGPTAVIAKY